MTPLAPLGLFAFAPTGGGDYESIQTVSVGSGGASYVEFSSIPSTYKHLQVRILQLTTSTTNPKFRVNSDSGSNYYMHSIYNNGSTISAYNDTTTAISYCYNEGSYPAVSIIDLLDYTNSNKNKTFRMLTGYDANGGGYVFYRSGAWFNTAAVTTLRFIADSSNFLEGSHFALYGLKG